LAALFLSTKLTLFIQVFADRGQRCCPRDGRTLLRVRKRSYLLFVILFFGAAAKVGKEGQIGGRCAVDCGDGGVGWAATGNVQFEG
jgi:hypothetical protein